VRDGEVDGLILQDPYQMGYLSVWALVHHLAGYDVNAAGRDMTQSTGEHVITRDNIDAPSTVELFDPRKQSQRDMRPPKYSRK
jgi:ribose transport system substrate-binding protein